MWTAACLVSASELHRDIARRINVRANLLKTIWSTNREASYLLDSFCLIFRWRNIDCKVWLTSNTHHRLILPFTYSPVEMFHVFLWVYIQVSCSPGILSRERFRLHTFWGAGLLRCICDLHVQGCLKNSSKIVTIFTWIFTLDGVGYLSIF